MNQNKIQIVSAEEQRALVTSVEFGQLKDNKMITWKRKIYTKEEAGKNPSRVILNVSDDGVEIHLGIDYFYTYQFKKNEVGKYLKFYSYIDKFKMFDQFLVFYVEENLKTNIRITSVQRLLSDNEIIYTGQKISFSVEYSIPNEKVDANIQNNVKWKVKIDDQTERLIIGGLVILGGKIEFKVPEEWANKKITLLPYLYKETQKVSTEFDVDYFVPKCGGTMVEQIESNIYEVKQVFLGRDNSNRIFYINDKKEIVTIGYSATPYSFYDDESKSVISNTFIYTDDTSGGDFLNTFIKERKAGRLIHYMKNATGGEIYDFKKTNGTKNTIYTEKYEFYRGMPINLRHPEGPVYASARDIGNMLAGLVAGYNQIPWIASKAAFNALETRQNIKDKPDEYFILEFWHTEEGLTTRYAEKLGYNLGSAYAYEEDMYSRSKLNLPGEGHIQNRKTDYSKIKIVTEDESL